MTQDYLADLTMEYQPSGRLSAVGRLDKETTGLLLLTDDGHLSERVLRPGCCIKVYEATVKLRSPATCKSSTLRHLIDGVELSDGFARADSAEVIAEWQEAPGCSRLSHGPRNAKRAAKVKARKAAAAAAVRESDGELEQKDGCEGGEITEPKCQVAALTEAATVPKLPHFNVYLVRLGMRIGRNRIVRRLLSAVGLPCFELKRTAIGPLVLGLGGSEQIATEAIDAAAALAYPLGLELPGATCRLSATQEEALRAAVSVSE